MLRQGRPIIHGGSSRQHDFGVFHVNTSLTHELFPSGPLKTILLESMQLKSEQHDTYNNIYAEYTSNCFFREQL